MVTDIQMRPDYQAMVAAGTPQPPLVYLQTNLRATGAGFATLKVVEHAGPFDEARWLVRECGFTLEEGKYQNRKSVSRPSSRACC